MNNLIALVKVNLANFNLFSRIVKTNNKKNFTSIIFIFSIIFLLGYSVYNITSLSMPGYMALNIPYVILAQYFLISSIFILFTNIFQVKDTIFSFKDYDLLMSLPINRKIIIASKFLNLYISNMIYTLLFMLPSLISYVQYVDVGFIFYLYFILTLLIIPVVPIILAYIIGTIITFLSSSFKKKNIASYILNILLVVVVFCFSYKTQNMTSIDMANIGKSMINTFNNLYPLTRLYINIVSSYDFLSLIIYILIPVILFTLFLIFVNKTYLAIRKKIVRSFTKNDYKIKQYKVKSPLMALYIKEIKRYFSSPVYVLNTMFGCILFIIGLIMLITMGGDKVEEILNIPNLSNYIKIYSPLVLGIVCSMSCTTSSSISLEGKSLWIIKSIPSSPIKIFLSKILVNLTILIPTVLIGGTILGIFLKMDFKMMILLYLTPIAYSIFISIIGIIININFPVFNFQNEVKVVKQSVSSFLSIMIGVFIGIIPFIININIDNYLYICLITLIMIFVNILLYIYLSKICPKIFNKLG